MKNVFWDITPCGPLHANGSFGETTPSLLASKSKRGKKAVRTTRTFGELYGADLALSFLSGIAHSSSGSLTITSSATSKVSKGILVTDRGGLYGSEIWRIPHCLDNWPIGDGSVVSLTRRPRFTTRGIFWYSFLLEAQ
jgi:hypothetical protein